MAKIVNFLDKYGLIIVGFLLIPACWALFVPGFYGASDDIHIAWLFEFHKTLFSGKIPPRFIPDLSFGFGYPLFAFVFPLPFYISEIFHLVGFNLVDSIKALFFITIPMSFLFMYLLLRQFSSRMLSIAGALLYVYTPYRAVDLYIRGAIGEILSFVFLPAILLSIIKLRNSKNFKWVGIGAIATASLVLSHNIASYMFLPFVMLFILMQFFTNSHKKEFLTKSILMIFLGFLISIYFWLPALIESSLMKYDTVFNFVDHFPTIIQLIKPYWGYGASVAGPYDGMSFFLGIANLVVLVLAILLGFRFWPKLDLNVKLIFIWGLITFFVTIFLMNYRSSFLWSNLPLLPYFQFPWRFLILTTFVIPLFLIIFERFKAKNLIALSIIVLILITSSSYFRPQDFLGRTDEYFLNRYIPTPIASEEYKATGEEYLRLPKDTQVRPDQNYPLITADNATIEKIYRQNDLDASSLINSNGSIVNYNKYYFPGWVAEIDGVKTEIAVGQPFGQITVFVPPGQHTVNFTFKETLFRNTLNAISLAAFLVSLGIAKILWLRRK